MSSAVITSRHGAIDQVVSWHNEIGLAVEAQKSEADL